jgi:hypothetical protein
MAQYNHESVLWNPENVMPSHDDIRPFRDLPTEAHERLRKKSKVLMGNRDRLEVAVAVAVSEDGVVNATDISQQLGMANNRVRANLLAFAEVELLDDAPLSQSGRRWFIRRSNPFWSLCLELYAAWAAESVNRRPVNDQ